MGFQCLYSIGIEGAEFTCGTLHLADRTEVIAGKTECKGMYFIELSKLYVGDGFIDHRGRKRIALNPENVASVRMATILIIIDSPGMAYLLPDLPCRPKSSCGDTPWAREEFP